MATCPSGHESASGDFCDVCGIRIGVPELSSLDPGPGSPSGTTGAAGAVGDATTADGATAAGGTCPRCGAPRDGQFCEDCGWNFADGTAPVPPPPQSPSASRPASPPSRPAPPPSQADPGDTRYDPVPTRHEPLASPSAPASPPASASPTPASSVPGNGVSAPGVPAPGGSVPGGQATGTWSATVTADRAYYEAVLADSGPGAAIGFPAYCPERRFRLSGTEMRIGRRSASRGIEPEIDLTGPPADPGVSRLHAVLIASPDGGWSVLDPGSANGTLVNGREIHPNEPMPLREGDRVNLGAWTVLIVSRDN